MGKSESVFSGYCCDTEYASLFIISLFFFFFVRVKLFCAVYPMNNLNIRIEHSFSICSSELYGAS